MDSKHIREDKPRKIQPDEESRLSRDHGQAPAEEHTEEGESQIGCGTKSLQFNKEDNLLSDDNSMEDGHRSGINIIDDRDNEKDSSTDWNGENNRTGRHR